MALIATADAASRLNVSTRRVVQMIGSGRLKAKKIGRDWLIDEKNLASVADRKPGRPRKSAESR